MTPDEAAKIAVLAAAMWPGNVPEETQAVWAAAMAPFDFADAREALHRYAEVADRPSLSGLKDATRKVMAERTAPAPKPLNTRERDAAISVIYAGIVEDFSRGYITEEEMPLEHKRRSRMSKAEIAQHRAAKKQAYLLRRAQEAAQLAEQQRPAAATQHARNEAVLKTSQEDAA